MKNLSGYLVHTEVVNILALFTRNCGTAIGAVHTELWNTDIFKQSEYEHDS